MCESRSDPASAQWQTDTLLKCLTAKNITILPFKTLSHSTLCRTITILKLTEDLNTSCFKGAGFSFCPSFQKHFEVLLVVRCIHGDVKWSRIAWQLLTRLPWNLVWIFLVPRPLLLISVATQSFYCATIVWHSRLLQSYYKVQLKTGVQTGLLWRSLMWILSLFWMWLQFLYYCLPHVLYYYCLPHVLFL